jgi:hypothetical protein
VGKKSISFQLSTQLKEVSYTMDAIFSSLRPRTPEPSFEDILGEFSLTQSGEGVLTRRQARLAELQPQPAAAADNSSADLGAETRPDDGHDVVPPERQPDQLPDTDRLPEADVQSEPEASEVDDETAPYLKDTLVAENEDLQAYVIKTHFRRLKNFA